jgi:uncharacterized small protein (DUF1192 family)
MDFVEGLIYPLAYIQSRRTPHMDEEDDRPKAPLLKQLLGQDLDALSQEDLLERIAVLTREIKRCEDAIDGKKSSRLSAETFFR